MARLSNCGSVEQWRQGDSCAEVRLIGALDSVVRWHGSSAMLRRYPRWFFVPGGVVPVWSTQGVRDMLQTLEFRRRSDGCCRDQERTIVAVEQRFPLSLVGRCLGTFCDVYGRLQLRGDVCRRFTTSDGASHCLATRSHVWRRLATCVDISRACCCRPSFWIYLGQAAGSTPVHPHGDVRVPAALLCSLSIHACACVQCH